MSNGSGRFAFHSRDVTAMKCSVSVSKDNPNHNFAGFLRALPTTRSGPWSRLRTAVMSARQPADSFSGGTSRH